jgi:hypothetical protein
MISNETANTLEVLKANLAALEDQVWPLAQRQAEEQNEGVLFALVNLHLRIQALEFAIAKAPKAGPGDHGKFGFQIGR